MNGVEILASNEVVAESIFNWDAFLIFGGIILAILIIVGIILSCTEYDWTNLVFCIFFGLTSGTMFGALAGTIFVTPMAYETQYKVIISDEVQMNDFLETYEIVDQEGKIYTVVERNEQP